MQRLKLRRSLSEDGCKASVPHKTKSCNRCCRNKDQEFDFLGSRYKALEARSVHVVREGFGNEVDAPKKQK